MAMYTRDSTIGGIGDSLAGFMDAYNKALDEKMRREKMQHDMQFAKKGQLAEKAVSDAMQKYYSTPREVMSPGREFQAPSPKGPDSSSLPGLPNLIGSLTQTEQAPPQMIENPAWLEAGRNVRGTMFQAGRTPDQVAGFTDIEGLPSFKTTGEKKADTRAGAEVEKQQLRLQASRERDASHERVAAGAADWHKAVAGTNLEGKKYGVDHPHYNPAYAADVARRTIATFDKELQAPMGRVRNAALNNEPPDPADLDLIEKIHGYSKQVHDELPGMLAGMQAAPTTTTGDGKTPAAGGATKPKRTEQDWAGGVEAVAKSSARYKSALAADPTGKSAANELEKMKQEWLSGIR